MNYWRTFLSFSFFAHFFTLSNKLLRMAVKKAKKKELGIIDHEKVEYEPVRKDFYVEPPDLADMTKDEVDLLRAELDCIKIRVFLLPLKLITNNSRELNVLSQ